MRSDTMHSFLVGLHVAAGVTAVVSGVIAMRSRKRRGRHPRAGRVYLWALTVVVITAAALGTLNWPHDLHLLALAAVAAGSAAVGYTARHVRWRGWLPWHITGMASSYIVMLTAFYVDNGPRLPLWSLLPPAALWLLPAAIGLPLLVRALQRYAVKP